MQPSRGARRSTTDNWKDSSAKIEHFDMLCGKKVESDVSKRYEMEWKDAWKRVCVLAKGVEECGGGKKRVMKGKRKSNGSKGESGESKRKKAPQFVNRV